MEKNEEVTKKTIDELAELKEVVIKSDVTTFTRHIIGHMYKGKLSQFFKIDKFPVSKKEYDSLCERIDDKNDRFDNVTFSLLIQHQISMEGYEKLVITIPAIMVEYGCLDIQELEKYMVRSNEVTLKAKQAGRVSLDSVIEEMMFGRQQ